MRVVCVINGYKLRKLTTAVFNLTINTFETEASTDTELGIGASRSKHVSFFN